MYNQTQFSVQPPQRHGCLTAWLVFMFIGNTLVTVTAPFMVGLVGKSNLNVSYFNLVVIFLGGISNLACVIALFRWYKWGFYGFVGMSVIGTINNLLMGISIGKCIFGFVGIGLLYLMLNIGDSNKAWPQLK